MSIQNNGLESEPARWVSEVGDVLKAVENLRKALEELEDARNDVHLSPMPSYSALLAMVFRERAGFDGRRNVRQKSFARAAEAFEE